MSTGERFQIEPLERRRLLAGAIEGVVFNDLNGNATRDATEGVWPGITVWLDLNRNRAQDAGEPSAVTDATGTYRFDGLTAGEYSVRMAEPAWSRQTSPEGARASLVRRESPYTANATFIVNQEVSRSFGQLAGIRNRWTTPANVSMSRVRVARAPDRLFVYTLPWNSTTPSLHEINPVSGALIKTTVLGNWASNATDIVWLNGLLYLWENGRAWTYDPATGALGTEGPSSFAFGSSSFAADPRANELISLAPSGRTIRFESQTTYAYREVELAANVPTLAQRGLGFSDGVIVGIATTSQVTSVISVDAATGQLVGRFDWYMPDWYYSVAGEGWSDHLLTVADGATRSADFGLARLAGPTQTTLSRSRGHMEAAPATVEFLTTGITPGARIRILTGNEAAPTEQFAFDPMGSTELRFSLPYALGSLWVGIEQSLDGFRTSISDFYGVDTSGQSYVTSVSGSPTRDATPLLSISSNPFNMLFQDGRPIYGEWAQPLPASLEVPNALADGTYRFSVGYAEPGYTVQYNADRAITVDTTPPRVVSSEYERDRSVPQIVLQLSERTLGGQNSALQLIKLVGAGGSVVSGTPSLSPDQLTLTFTPAAPLADGRYRLLWTNRLDAAGNSANLNFDFHVLAGDANDDAVVNFDDLLILAANYNQSARVFSQGDFDRNGTVNFDDLLILASRYNTSIPGTVGAPPPPSVLASGDDEDGAPNDVLR